MPPILKDEPLLSAVFDYCRMRRGSRPLPSRADIDPLDIPRFALPNLVLFDVFEEGTRFRYRLCGTETVNRFGKDPTGRFADEVLADDYLAYVASVLREVCRDRVPVYSAAVFRWEVKRTMMTSRLYVPLADEGASIQHILAGHDFSAKTNPPRGSGALLRDARQVEELVRTQLPF